MPGLRPLALLLLGLLLASPLVAQDLHLRVLAATGTAEEVKKALQKGGDFNDHDGTGVTALMAAAGNNHDADVILVLLQFGAAVDTRDTNGETALMFAVERNADPVVIAALLSRGAGIETRDKLGRTPLIYATKSNAPGLDRTQTSVSSSSRQEPIPGRKASRDGHSSSMQLRTPSWGRTCCSFSSFARR